MPKRRASSKPMSSPVHDWRTTDEDEILRRRLRAANERHRFENLEPRHPIFGTFRVHSASGQQYQIEVRDPGRRVAVCTCIDFRVNELGTCKHIENLWPRLRRGAGAEWVKACHDGSPRIEVLPDAETNQLRLLDAFGIRRPAVLDQWFDVQGFLRPEFDPRTAIEGLRALAANKLPALRISHEAEAWLERETRLRDRRELRREYELKVQSGEWPPHETLVPLFPYQRDGMLHLAFTERALLADEMGLGKTIQAIAAAALLHRLGRARRVLVVTPASLKAEWEEQIRRFTALPCHLVFGSHHRRVQWLHSLASPPTTPPSADDPFFVVMNYEQVVADLPELNRLVRPDVVILDEAQRIKNWNTRVARTIKKLESRYAFVLTGTPIENRIDELRSLVDFLDPALLGPLFRFNREFYDFDERGRPRGYRNLDKLYHRVRPVLLRRRKAEVETELPPRTEENRFVEMAESQRRAYAAHEQDVMRLVNILERRPLTESELDRLQRELAMMRMVCDTPYILNPKDRTCPKLAELAPILENCRDNDTKVIVFSEWEGMLELVRELAEELNLAPAWHTGSVPQRKRRAEIVRFKEDPACRVFLSTDAGATGLNLQIASVVVNCDLPWNPARLEQRIARAWRKHQTRNVTVINLITDDSIESRMLETLATKRAVAESVLDADGTITDIPLRSGRKDMVDRVRVLVGGPNLLAAPARARTGPPPARVADPETLAREAEQKLFRVDPAAALARALRRRVGSSVLSLEERFPANGQPASLLVVVPREAGPMRERIEAIREDFLRRHAESDSPTVSSASTAPLPRIEVLDQATHDAVERLVAAGLLAPTTRFTRSLTLEPADTAAPTALTPECRAALIARRDSATRLLRRASVLGEAGFEDECRASLREAADPLAAALCLAARLPEPAKLEDTFVPPFARVWADSLAQVEAFSNRETVPWSAIHGVFERKLRELPALA